MPLCSCSFFGESSCLIFPIYWSPHTALNHVDDVITSAVVGGFDSVFLLVSLLVKVLAVSSKGRSCISLHNSCF